MATTDEASALFKSYHDRIYRYLLSLVHNPAEADDLTQDTLSACIFPSRLAA